MTTLYADFDLGTGNEDGSDAANAWHTHQDAIDGLNTTPPTTADIVLSKGTDTIATRIDQDQDGGVAATGKLVYRGVNGSWSNDGTRAIIDGNNNAIDLLHINGPDHIRYENFVFKNTSAAAGQDGITAQGYATSYGWEFINCVFDDCHDLINLGSSSLLDPFFYKCQFLNAAGFGYSPGNNNSPYTVMVGCIFDTITLQGIVTAGARVFLLDCYFIDITGNAVEIGNDLEASLLYNSTIDGCADGLQNIAPVRAIGLRITNNTVGIDSDTIVTLLNSYMPHTGEDRANTTKTTGIVDEIVIDGANSNNISGTDTDGGYTNPGAGDFNLDADKASQYNQEVDLET